ncbi:unnamed protein product [Ambrosiozyma monospora]|uniref:Unnamed protein product n=1 Tax=Ambrosiozyma monospora TaxID=43982 RepID=A0ACB5SQR4_AMBMO|nr:unnamed protein product [Ambrosiozyma monospora]
MSLCYPASTQESSDLTDFEYELAVANDDHFSNFQLYSSNQETAGLAAEIVDTEMEQSTVIDEQFTVSEDLVTGDVSTSTLFEPISTFYDASGAPIIDFEGVDLFDIDLTNVTNDDVVYFKDDEKTLVDEDDYAEKSKSVVNEDKSAEKPETPVKITKSENFSVLPSAFTEVDSSKACVESNCVNNAVISSSVESSNACVESNCVNNVSVSNSVELCEDEAENDIPKIQEIEREWLTEKVKGEGCDDDCNNEDDDEDDIDPLANLTKESPDFAELALITDDESDTEEEHTSDDIEDDYVIVDKCDVIVGFFTEMLGEDDFFVDDEEDDDKVNDDKVNEEKKNEVNDDSNEIIECFDSFNQSVSQAEQKSSNCFIVGEGLQSIAIRGKATHTDTSSTCSDNSLSLFSPPHAKHEHESTPEYSTIPEEEFIDASNDTNDSKTSDNDTQAEPLLPVGLLKMPSWLANAEDDASLPVWPSNSDNNAESNKRPLKSAEDESSQPQIKKAKMESSTFTSEEDTTADEPFIAPVEAVLSFWPSTFEKAESNKRSLEADQDDNCQPDIKKARLESSPMFNSEQNINEDEPIPSVESVLSLLPSNSVNNMESNKRPLDAGADESSQPDIKRARLESTPMFDIPEADPVSPSFFADPVSFAPMGSVNEVAAEVSSAPVFLAEDVQPITEENQVNQTNEVTQVNTVEITNTLTTPDAPTADRPHGIVLTDIIPTTVSALPAFSSLRIMQTITLEEVIESNRFLSDPTKWMYEPTDSEQLTAYSPRIYRYYAADHATRMNRARKVVHRQGLCPYCPLRIVDGVHRGFYDLNSSDYAVHMMYHHGIFTTGSFCLEPTLFRMGEEHTARYQRSRLVECVKCPYEGCPIVTKVNVRQTGCKVFAAYLRHIRYNHIDRKNRRRSV